MKKLFYIGVIAMIVASCSTGKYVGGGYEDDLYYNPKDKPLVIQEVEEQLPDVSAQEKKELLEIAKKSVAENPEKYPDITDVDRIEIESVEYKTNTKTGAIDTIIEIMSQGYWINGFRGSNAELEEAMRTIEQYPNGFGSFGRGYDIGENLSFDSDWNVYTRDGKYWWFPRVTNLTMYNQFMFGRYPRYEWTVIWDSPHYDYWDFDFHFGSSSYWRWRSYDRWYHRSFWYRDYWYSPGWHVSVGYVDPWYYRNSWHDYPYYRRYYGRHSKPAWYKDNYRYGPRKSMYTKTVRSNTYGTTYRSTSGLKSVRSSATRNTTGVRSGSSTVKSRSGSGRVTTRGTNPRYRSSGSTVKTGTGKATTRSRYSSQNKTTRSRATTTTTKTTTQSRKSTVRRYNRPKSTTRPSYNRGTTRTRTRSTYNKGTGRKSPTASYKRAPNRSSSSNRNSSGSYNKSGSSSNSRGTYNSSSRSRSSSSSTRSSSTRSTSRSSSSRSGTRGRTR